MGSQEQNCDLENPSTCASLFQLDLSCILHLISEVLQILALNISAWPKLPPLHWSEAFKADCIQGEGSDRYALGAPGEWLGDQALCYRFNTEVNISVF